jgi:hypothetical protein
MPPGQPIAPYTLATAHDAGWIWDIALPDRRGTGCVYSSAHMSDDEAEATIRRYAGPAGEKLSTRRLQFRTGYRAQQWIGNCAAVGLAAGFFEPLESTGIMLIEVAAHLLGQMLAVPSDPAVMAASARSFNRLMTARFGAITDFLKLHYCISRRRDTPYWRDNTDPASWSDSLRDRIEQWRHRVLHASISWWTMRASCRRAGVISSMAWGSRRRPGRAPSMPIRPRPQGCSRRWGRCIAGASGHCGFARSPRLIDAIHRQG